MDLEEVDAFVAGLDDAAGVPPMREAHEKAQASLDGDADAVRAAITMAWERQRTARVEEETP